jgi:hypothetical protein
MARALGTGGRFFLAYLLLGALVGTGIGLFIILLERKGPGPPPAWSTWRPVSSSTATQAQEIARHVGGGYRLARGRPLARVALGALGQSQESILPIGIPKTLRPKSLSDFQFFQRDESLVYTLCGAGQNCRIRAEEATVAQDTALRREALELALYTFEYATPIDHVAVLFPPGPKQKRPSSALFFHRDDLASQLGHPLHTTLPASRPPLPGRIDPAEKKTVIRLTGPRVYRYLGIASEPSVGQWLMLFPAG